MADKGSATLDFGAFPGAVESQVDVSGQSGFVAASKVEAWVLPIATADHTADEHLVENLRVMAVYKTDGTFMIRGFCADPPAMTDINYNWVAEPGAQRQRVYGQWTIGWVWA